MSSSDSTTALRMSAGSPLDVVGSAHHRRAQLAVTAQLANGIAGANFHPPVVGSTVVPSTAFLSSRRAGEAGLSIPSAASKYGGRASGSCDTAGAAAGGETTRNTALVNSSRGSLGFVVVGDIPSASASSKRSGRTSLAVSRSIPDQVDQMDASFFNGGGGDGSADDDRRRLGDLVDDAGEIGIVEADGATSSPVRRRVAESLRRNAAASSNNSNNSKSAEKSAPSTVPAWVPWIPTRSQIETLKVPELRDACDERGLAKVRKSGVHSRVAWKMHVLIFC